MTTPGERFKYFMELHGYNRQRVHDDTGIDPNVISSYVNDTRTIGRANLDKIAHAYPMLSIDWLLYGRGQMLPTYEEAEGLDPLSYVLANYLRTDENTRKAAINFLVKK